MGWSFQVARIAGINIKVHVTFFIILALSAYQWAGSTPDSPLGSLFGAVLMIALFTCVTLHELGHSLAAQRLGIPVTEISLLPLGGVAMMSRNPDKPLHELIIAAAGPLVNVVIAAVLFAATGGSLSLLDGRGQLFSTLNTPSLNTLLMWLLGANVSLVVFNLIPAFPLDGGRMFRALLALAIGSKNATRIAVALGQIIAIGLGLFAIYSSNFLLVLVAVFIFFGASQEAAQAPMEAAKALLSTQIVGDAYNKNAITLMIGDRASKVVNHILTSYQPDFAVMQGPKPIGIVTRANVLHALASQPNDPYVTEIMQRDFLRVDAALSLQDVRAAMAEKGAPVAAVFKGPDYLGLVSTEDLREAMTVLAFVQHQKEMKAALASAVK